MKKLLSVVLIAISLQCYTQELMTVGEVFDFEVNDRFHYRSETPMVPPNANRVEIIGKYYSMSNDTVNYIRFHDSYYTEVIWEPEPHLEYTFWTKTDTVSYTMLDSCITYYQGWATYDTSMYSYDTLIYYSEDYCDSTINGYEYATSSFEPDVFIREYGKGLGEVWFWWSSGSAPNPGVQADYGIFYYQKNGIDCGIPDTITVSVTERYTQHCTIFVYPNPFTTSTSIEYELTKPSHVQLTIYNTIGETIYVAQEGIKQQGKHSFTWSPEMLPEGMYYAVLRSEEGVSVVKMVKQ